METWKEEFYATDYGQSYLMHYRTKGSKNGISRTEGYKAIGTLAGRNAKAYSSSTRVSSDTTSGKKNTITGKVGNIRDKVASAASKMAQEGIDEQLEARNAYDRANGNGLSDESIAERQTIGERQNQLNSYKKQLGITSDTRDDQILEPKSSSKFASTMMDNMKKGMVDSVEKSCINRINQIADSFEGNGLDDETANKLEELTGVLRELNKRKKELAGKYAAG